MVVLLVIISGAVLYECVDLPDPMVGSAKLNGESISGDIKTCLYEFATREYTRTVGLEEDCPSSIEFEF
tara:strand:- start:9 stop:215 length:207 start_codon:yes stop_codon:yes gene_type:complete